MNIKNKIKMEIIEDQLKTLLNQAYAVGYDQGQKDKKIKNIYDCAQTPTIERSPEPYKELTLKPGSLFSFKGFDWVCLDPNAEEGNGVLAIMVGPWNGKEYPFDTDGYNNYAKSDLREKLLRDLLPVLGEENLLPHTVDLTADNGDNTYGTVTDKVFILSCDEYRKYRNYVPLYFVFLEEWMLTCTPWWIDPSSGSGNFVSVINSKGDVCYIYATNDAVVFPACIFKIEKLVQLGL